MSMDWVLKSLQGIRYTWPWTDYQYARAIAIYNSSMYHKYDFTTFLFFNTRGMIADGKMRADCGDTIIALGWNPQITKTRAVWDPNTINTTFIIKVDIPRHDGNCYWLYYGNPAQGYQPPYLDDVSIWGDNFEYYAVANPPPTNRWKQEIPVGRGDIIVTGLQGLDTKSLRCSQYGPLPYLHFSALIPKIKGGLSVHCAIMIPGTFANYEFGDCRSPSTYDWYFNRLEQYQRFQRVHGPGGWRTYMPGVTIARWYRIRTKLQWGRRKSKVCVDHLSRDSTKAAWYIDYDPYTEKIAFISGTPRPVFNFFIDDFMITKESVRAFNIWVSEEYTKEEVLAMGGKNLRQFFNLEKGTFLDPE